MCPKSPGMNSAFKFFVPAFGAPIFLLQPIRLADLTQRDQEPCWMGHLGFASLVHIQNKAKLCLSASLSEAQFCTSPELENTLKFPWRKKKKKNIVVLSKTSSQPENSISSLTILLQTCKFTCSFLNVQPPLFFFSPCFSLLSLLKC